ncbi:MAG: diaminopimelate epimerase [Candidatus Wallbacteria bacterium HGW-Wallbacteria-1]|uniref:Diaminopimelate epimerase n=1 Tax=Candidatus Wallbacteria bacterium HGW-Wallbacteria-1 TaxID=2013854 RepID=A0A2N1PQ25_9BACT|nr:MAG: diaminopimelate epimerase [Candidatus Wallbacteria bacterium HGW-Wallbacteria-1]
MVPFKKMHGVGNDFVIFDLREKNFLAHICEDDLRNFAVRVANRNFGVGCDGVMLVLPSESCDYRMRIINADGSEAEMCGNGIRCFARFLFDHGLIVESGLTVETMAGVIRPRINTAENTFQSVTVDMGLPILDPRKIPVDLTGYPYCGDGKLISFPLSLGEGRFEITCVSMGNPHAITFVDSLDFDIRRIGPVVEKHHLFPKKTNVEFVQVVNRSEIRMRVWERGVGETLGCGTGSSAAVVACHLNGRTDRDVTVHLPGGDLQINIDEDERVFMTGPASYSFEGVLEPEVYLK